MRVMHVIDGLVAGGAERMLVDIANATASDGHEISICVTRSDTTLADQLIPQVSLHVLGRRKRFDWPAMRQFALLVKSNRIEILQSHSRSTLSFLVVLKTLGLITTPIIMHDHFGRIEIDASIPFWFRFWGRHHLSRYVAVHEKLRAWALSAGVPPSKAVVIENAVNLDRIREACPVDLRGEFQIPDDYRVGLVTANIRREKGIDLLLEAVARSCHRDSVRILVAGDYFDEAYAAQCLRQRATLGLESTVIFIGSRSDVPGIIRAADFALLPSRSESGPLVLIEYMAGGLPFISTKVGSIADRVAEMGIPEFVSPGNPTAFTAGMDRLLSLTQEEKRARGRAGQAVALREFDIRSRMRQWNDQYEFALRTRQR